MKSGYLVVKGEEVTTYEFPFALAPTSATLDEKMFNDELWMEFGDHHECLVKPIWLNEVDDLQITMTSIEPSAMLVVLVNDTNSTVISKRLFPKAETWHLPIIVISSNDGSYIKALMENWQARLSVKLSSKSSKYAQPTTSSGAV